MTDYVLLETGQDERFLTDIELKDYLRPLVAKQESLEGEVLEKTLQQLLDTACELNFGPGQYVQWYETTIDQPTHLSRFGRSQR